MWSKHKRNKRRPMLLKGKQTFEGLVVKKTMVKMKKPGKKKALTTSWEGPYQFIGHVDGKGDFDFEEGNFT
jgi:hypothetical protein